MAVSKRKEDWILLSYLRVSDIARHARMKTKGPCQRWRRATGRRSRFVVCLVRNMHRSFTCISNNYILEEIRVRHFWNTKLMRRASNSRSTIYTRKQNTLLLTVLSLLLQHDVTEALRQASAQLGSPSTFRYPISHHCHSHGQWTRRRDVARWLAARGRELRYIYIYIYIVLYLILYFIRVLYTYI